MFDISINTSTKLKIDVIPNAKMSDDMRYIHIEGYPAPIIIQPTLKKGKKVFKIFDGEISLFLATKKTNHLFVVVEPPIFTVSNGEDRLMGKLIKPFKRLLPVTGINWNPPNPIPVYVGTELTISWHPVTHADFYAVDIYKGQKSKIFNPRVTATSFTFKLSDADLYHWFTAKISAHSKTKLPSDESVSPKYYAGNYAG